MSKRLLSLQKTPCLFRDYPCEGMARLVNVNLPDTRLPRILLEVLGEGVRGERRAGLARPVMPSPQWPFRCKGVHPLTRAEVIKQRLPHCRFFYRPCDIVTALDSASQEYVFLPRLNVRAA